MASFYTVSLLLTAATWCVSANVVVPDSNNSSSASIADGTAATTGPTTAEAPPPPLSPPTITVFNSSGDEGTDDSRDSRFLSFSMGSSDSATAAATNALQEKQDETGTDPSAHLVDIYTDCLMQLSFPCVQRKLLLFLDKLGRMKGFSVLGDLLSVVRIKRDMRPPLNETDLMARLNTVDEQSALSALMEHTLDRFIGSHILRITLPPGITAALKGKARSISGNTLDINLSRSIEEGRGKGKKYKKMMQMMMMGLMGKMALMGPLMMLMIKVKAIKALLLSKLALLMSLAQLMRGKKGGGGGGHGKEVIIVHDSHGGGGSADYAAAAPAGWISGHTATGWSTGGGADSYSAGSHIGGGDTSYAGAQDTYASGAGAPSGWAAVNGHGASGWARKSMVHEPHWVAYRAYIPTPEDQDRGTEK
ncbi:Protein of unknown function DUF1676 [Cinara cedri]|uniref:Uncharacterized protein n=1 Tax=Cinara cedri TaxID=506608 RepID=A0A5E4MRE8_9HEMI|nr:Protein of unknown function DUF1676 [Cinara cedri]